MHGSFGTLLGSTPLIAELMEHGSKVQGKTQAEGGCTLLRQGHCLVALCQPLVRIPKIPQRPHGVDVANHASILPIEERRGTVLRGVVQGYPLRKVGVRSGYRSQVV